jgi:dynein heavy chain, axonemal
MTYIVAMAPPAGGKNTVSSRFIRHFNVISCNNFDDTVLERIFSKLMDWHICQHLEPSSVSARVLKNLVNCSVDIFLYVQKELKPTPSKTHYLFNLRDLSRIV